MAEREAEKVAARWAAPRGGPRRTQPSAVRALKPRARLGLCGPESLRKCGVTAWEPRRAWGRAPREQVLAPPLPACRWNGTAGLSGVCGHKEECSGIYCLSWTMAGERVGS